MDVESSYGPLPPKATDQPWTVTTESIDTADWWTTLNDPTLNALIEQAVEANRDLRLATARIREARARRAVAGAGRYPKLNAGAGYSYSRASKNAWPYNAFDAPGFPWESGLYELGFDASWELDIFGAVRHSTEAASADLQATMENWRSVLVSILAEVGRCIILRKTRRIRSTGSRPGTDLRKIRYGK